ncbi:hypothetical protein EUX98_g217 [Antrodiella citrinella]|uniref:Uncharacterized protein n=1 Tax=Antrodiella citrinella TaxID=2447956 RepID=A0A4S4N4A3_9APHY|nr:hypothetical protein EUX98_g217 [Antrodiella citrinella]
MSSRVHFQAVPPYRAATNFVSKWGLSLGLWGAGAGITALYLLSVTPLVKREFLTKVPLLGSYYEDKIPASDKPF